MRRRVPEARTRPPALATGTGAPEKVAHQKSGADQDHSLERGCSFQVAVGRASHVARRICRIRRAGRIRGDSLAASRVVAHSGRDLGRVDRGLGWVCPLTPLENAWRVRAGESGYSGGAIDHYVVSALYPAGSPEQCSGSSAHVWSHKRHRVLGRVSPQAPSAHLNTSHGDMIGFAGTPAGRDGQPLPVRRPAICAILAEQAGDAWRRPYPRARNPCERRATRPYRAQSMQPSCMPRRLARPSGVVTRSARLPRRVVAHVLCVSALEIRDPLPFIVEDEIRRSPARSLQWSAASLALSHPSCWTTATRDCTARAGEEQAGSRPVGAEPARSIHQRSSVVAVRVPMCRTRPIARRRPLSIVGGRTKRVCRSRVV